MYFVVSDIAVFKILLIQFCNVSRCFILDLWSHFSFISLLIVSNFILLWNQSFVLYANCNFVLILLWNSFYTGYGVITTRPFKNKEDLLEYKGTLVSRDEGKKLHQEYAKEGLGCYIFDVECGNKNLWYEHTCFVMIDWLNDMH